jgi:CO dehydrogenase/acetyl-CoA synthase gamma subunit (corrinoid Fe-S protein)
LFQLASWEDYVRRAALKAGVKALGYPTLKYVDTGHLFDDALEAGLEISKYGALVVLPEFDPAQFVSLLALRQNIYTDPQKPIQVEPQIYSIGEPDEQSPVFVTTNFSLTYFIVSGLRCESRHRLDGDAVADPSYRGDLVGNGSGGDVCLADECSRGLFRHRF